MAPKPLKRFNKAHTGCSLEWRAAVPQLGKMTSRRQYRFQLHDRGPLMAVPATRRAILFHNKAGGSHRAQRHGRWPCRACDRAR